MRRLKESIRNLEIVVICLLGVWGITELGQYLESVFQVSEEASIEEESRPIISEEENLVIDSKMLFAYKDSTLEKREDLGELITKLPRGNQVEYIAVSNKNKPYVVTINYKEEGDKRLNRPREEQLMLLNGTLLIGLYQDIDAVKIISHIGEETIERVVYKPDLDSYFGEDVRGYQQLEAFEVYATTFLDSEKASTYWHTEYTYTSILGEEVDEFFKLNFPIEPLEIGDTVMELDEILGDNLLEIYGYKLFLEGLRYENDYMNYYSAYRLIEFYGHEDLEEILIELAVCKSKTTSDQVRLACEYAIEVLESNLEETKLITRFRESEYKGGEKAYILTKGKFYELCSWKDEQPAGICYLSLSPSEKYVYCLIGADERSYAYVLPNDTDAGFILSKEGVIAQDSQISNELIEECNKVYPYDNEAYYKEGKKLEEKWLTEDILELAYVEQEERITYLYHVGLEQTITLVKEQALDRMSLREELSSHFKVREMKNTSEVLAQAGSKSFNISGEKLITYELKNHLEAGMKIFELQELLQANQNDLQGNSIHFFVRDDVLMIYIGSNIRLTSTLSKYLGQPVSTYEK